GAGVGGLRTPARCLDSGVAYPCLGLLNPSSAALPRNRSLQLALVHAGATVDPQALRLVVELLLGLSLLAVRARALAASPLWRGTTRRAARARARLSRACTVLVDRAGSHLACARCRSAPLTGGSLDLLV